MSNSNTRSALVAATLTGLFTVAASLLTYYISTKEPELSYTVVGSPTVTGESGTKRIFVAVVTNTGRKEIGNVLTRIALPNGELGELTYETSPGVKIVRTDDRNAIELVADMLNQGDFLKASFLVTSPAAGSVPNVAVRAPGVKGTLKLDPSEQGERDKIASLISVLSGALTAVLMSFLLFTRSHLAVKMGLSRGSALEQAEICAFICHALNRPGFCRHSSAV